MNQKDQVIITIMQQINWRGLKIAGFQFIKIDDITLRLHKDKKNFDIKYDYGSDTYTIYQHRIKTDYSVETKTIQDIYFDQLQDLIADFYNLKT